MEPGNIVEYIDRQRIICAVATEVKTQRLRLLTENNREVKLSANRVLYRPVSSIDPSLGRDSMVERLKEAAAVRRELMAQVDVEELWEVLHPEQEWIDLETMTELAFTGELTGHHRSAVVRAFFHDRTYFKFDNDKYFPYTLEQVEKIRLQQAEAERIQKLIQAGGDWIKAAARGKTEPPPEEHEARDRYVEILKSLFLFEKESSHYEVGKGMLERAGIEMGEPLFELLVDLGVWDPDENIDLHRLEVPTRFPDGVLDATASLVAGPSGWSREDSRRDLTHLDLVTIDGQATLDFDDAISIEPLEDHLMLGVHIADVGHFIRRDEGIDREAISRASSIYMPDQKIPMLPPNLAEGLCSLKAGEQRPAISVLIRLSKGGEILDFEVVPSVIQVKHQLTYYDVNLVAEENRKILLLHEIAKRFRQMRLSEGAVQITLPEINIWINGDGELVVSRTNRESPGRMLVAEVMIMANWLMAKFLSEKGIPAIFRSQPNPRERLYSENGGSLFQNWMQRKLLSRFVLGHGPERHAGLGLNAYVTATSPIRKYFDLVTQRQIRSAFGLETPYTADEIDQAIISLEQPMSTVMQMQNRRKRYWLLKYLEGKVGEREQAIVLQRRKGHYLVLIPEYLIECALPAGGGHDLKPEDVIRVTIQHVDARKDVFSVFLS